MLFGVSCVPFQRDWKVAILGVVEARISIGLLGAGAHARELEKMFAASHQVVFNAVGAGIGQLTSGEIDIALHSAPPHHIPVVAAVGNPATKQRLVESWPGDTFVNLLSQLSIVREEFNSFGHGVIVADGVTLTSGISIADHVSINIGATLSHGVVVGEFSTISPSASIGGEVVVGKNCFIGIGATIIDHVTLCDGVTIGAGAVVISSIEVAGTYVGVPARRVSSG